MGSAAASCGGGSRWRGLHVSSQNGGDRADDRRAVRRAYHEQALFNRDHVTRWKRGLAGATGDILNPGLGNVGPPEDTAAFALEAS
jgi:hypothetical protein